MRTNAVEPLRDWRAGRRLWTPDLHERGWQGKAIAEASGVTAGAVSQWLKRARTPGRKALWSHPPPGPTPKLTGAQRAALPGVLAKGAEAHGFVGHVWTTARIAVVIRRAFGVGYHPAHVSRLMRQLGRTVHNPLRRRSHRERRR